MNRRSFFKSMIGGVATAAAVRTFPFRVFSFPTALSLESFTEMYVNPAMAMIFADEWGEAPDSMKIGQAITIRRPQRFAINPSRMLVDREALTVESWDAQSGTMRLRIPGRSEHPFTGIVTG